MTANKDLVRFLAAQNQMYLQALSEVKRGQKKSHWMWFVFPQIDGLGSSDTAKYFAIKNLQEAKAYLDHPVLGKNLSEISLALLNVDGKSAVEIFGTPDDKKLRSSMTLFSIVEGSDPVFGLVLQKFFNGAPDETTLRKLGNP